jgi:hypothetical protein
MDKRRVAHACECLLWKSVGVGRVHERGVLVMGRRRKVLWELFISAVVVEDEWQVRV